MYIDVSIDGDNPDHIMWIFKKSQDRAAEYGIQGVTYRLTQGITTTCFSLNFHDPCSPTWATCPMTTSAGLQFDYFLLRVIQLHKQREGGREGGKGGRAGEREREGGGGKGGREGGGRETSSEAFFLLTQFRCREAHYTCGCIH